jgi:nucleoredoxin
MRLLFRLLWFVLLVSPICAKQLPLTAKEISLMLRSGYSSEALMRELSVRHFAETCDEATTKLLAKSGASPALVQALAAGAYAIPPEEKLRAQEALAAESKRRAAAVEDAKKFNTLYQHQLAQERAVAPARQSVRRNALYPLLKGDLVCWRNGTINRFEDEAIEKKKLIAFYFSAHWCAPCRKFTPQLVEYYNRVAAQHPEFEIILVSYDRSAFGFETYLRDAQMPWPAIDFQKVGSKDAVVRYSGAGIPDLVLVDETGKVLSDSYVGKEYRGPQKVLTDLDEIFAASAKHLAQGQ